MDQVVYAVVLWPRLVNSIKNTRRPASAPCAFVFAVLCAALCCCVLFVRAVFVVVSAAERQECLERCDMPSWPAEGLDVLESEVIGVC